MKDKQYVRVTDGLLKFTPNTAMKGRRYKRVAIITQCIFIPKN